MSGGRADAPRIRTLQSAVQAYTAPSATGLLAGTIAAGTEVVVLHEDAGWLELSDGQFIPAVAAEAGTRRAKRRLGPGFWSVVVVGAGFLVWLGVSILTPDPYGDAESICTGTVIRMAADAKAAVDVEWTEFEVIGADTLRADGSASYRAEDNRLIYKTFTCEAAHTKAGYFDVRVYPR